MASYGSRAEMPPDVDPHLYHARSHGRTPAEHAALEAQLARRRAESRARVGPVRAASTPSRRPGPYTTSPSSLPQQRQQQSPSPAPRDGRTKAQIRAALLRPFGHVRRHPLRGQTNRGSGWHKKGYRSCGDMWINVKRSSVSYRGEDFNENMTLVRFVRRIQNDQDESDYHPHAGQDWDLRFRKKSLRQLLVDAESLGLGEQDLLLRDLMDGGETCYYKVLGENGKMVDDDL